MRKNIFPFLLALFLTLSFSAYGQTDKLIVDGDGNVGIGTGQPRAKLDVDGGVRVGSVADNACGEGNSDEGIMRYNTAGSTAGSKIEYCDGQNWRPFEESCPTGFVDTGYGYCIQEEPNSAATWGDALSGCFNDHDAQLCSTAEWYTACKSGVAHEMVHNVLGENQDFSGNCEWVSDHSGSAESTLIFGIRGYTSCEYTNHAYHDSSYIYRCCRSK